MGKNLKIKIFQDILFNLLTFTLNINMTSVTTGTTLKALSTMTASKGFQKIKRLKHFKKSIFNFLRLSINTTMTTETTAATAKITVATISS